MGKRTGSKDYERKRQSLRRKALRNSRVPSKGKNFIFKRTRVIVLSDSPPPVLSCYKGGVMISMYPSDPRYTVYSVKFFSRPSIDFKVLKYPTNETPSETLDVSFDDGLTLRLFVFLKNT